MSNEGVVHVRATVGDEEVVIGYWEFHTTNIEDLAKKLSLVHEGLRGSGDAISEALEVAASDAGLGMLDSVPDIDDLMATNPPLALGQDVEEPTEPTEEEYVEEIERRIKAETTRTLFVEGMRSARVDESDKKKLCVEIVKSDGVQILSIEYVPRGGSFSTGSAEIAKLSIEGDLVGCIPPRRAATLWRAGEGASQVRLHGGPRGCIQKLSPGEVLEIRETDTQRWLIRQVPLHAAHEPERAEALPAATIQDGPFWEDGSKTELTH